MQDLPYRQALDRIRSEYLEMPGMRLTTTQVQRLSGVEISVCRLVLEELVHTHFLYVADDGSYSRAAEQQARLRVAKAGLNATVIQSSRRES